MTKQDFTTKEESPLGEHCGRECPCEEFKELKSRVDDHDKRLYAGNTSFALIRKDIEAITQMCSETNSLIKEIQSKPTKRVETVVETVIRWAVPLILGFLISQIGVIQ